MIAIIVVFAALYAAYVAFAVLISRLLSGRWPGG
jgi:hypothetical protein